MQLPDVTGQDLLWFVLHLSEAGSEKFPHSAVLLGLHYRGTVKSVKGLAASWQRALLQDLAHQHDWTRKAPEGTGQVV